MTRGRYQHLAPPPKLAKEIVFAFLESVGFKLEKPSRKKKFWTAVVKVDLRILGVGREFRVKFGRIWNNDEWIDSVQALAEDRECWVELCSRTTHLGQDAM
ncbi:hypothetical protein RB195_018014 [Necator americanus]|uniref:Uncharacterized protein n=1 Tax=Necator americanus TaxID=51031 RepID=A0ABR1C7S8_NECAM